MDNKKYNLYIWCIFLFIWNFIPIILKYTTKINLNYLLITQTIILLILIIYRTVIKEFNLANTDWFPYLIHKSVFFILQIILVVGSPIISLILYNLVNNNSKISNILIFIPLVNHIYFFIFAIVLLMYFKINLVTKILRIKKT